MSHINILDVLCQRDNSPNNRMEMKAIVEALRDTEGHVQILTDSQLCIGLLAHRWKAKKNQDLIAEAKKLMFGRVVDFTWVRGHNGNQWNERADFLANTAVWARIKQP